MKLLTDGQLLQVQKFAELGMQTPITIHRRSVDTGLDAGYDDPYGSTVGYSDVTPAGGVKGWIHSSTIPVQQFDTGMVVTINTIRMYVPVGTDIKPGDEVHTSSAIYVVGDTTADETWPALLNCSLRTKE